MSFGSPVSGEFSMKALTNAVNIILKSAAVNASGRRDVIAHLNTFEENNWIIKVNMDFTACQTLTKKSYVGAVELPIYKPGQKFEENERINVKQVRHIYAIHEKITQNFFGYVLLNECSQRKPNESFFSGAILDASLFNKMLRAHLKNNASRRASVNTPGDLSLLNMNAFDQDFGMNFAGGDVIAPGAPNMFSMMGALSSSLSTSQTVSNHNDDRHSAFTSMTASSSRRQPHDQSRLPTYRNISQASAGAFWAASAGTRLSASSSLAIDPSAPDFSTGLYTTFYFTEKSRPLKPDSPVTLEEILEGFAGGPASESPSTDDRLLSDLAHQYPSEFTENAKLFLNTIKNILNFNINALLEEHHSVCSDTLRAHLQAAVKKEVGGPIYPIVDGILVGPIFQQGLGAINIAKSPQDEEILLYISVLYDQQGELVAYNFSSTRYENCVGLNFKQEKLAALIDTLIGKHLASRDLNPAISFAPAWAAQSRSVAEGAAEKVVEEGLKGDKHAGNAVNASDGRTAKKPGH